MVRITFYPAAVDLGWKRLKELKKVIPFKEEKPPNAPATRRAPKQWYCHLDEDSWNSGKAHLVEFVGHIDDAWRAREHTVSEEAEES